MKMDRDTRFKYYQILEQLNQTGVTLNSKMNRESFAEAKDLIGQVINIFAKHDLEMEEDLNSTNNADELIK